MNRRRRRFYEELLDREREKVKSCFDCIYYYLGGSGICYIREGVESYKEAEKCPYYTPRDKITAWIRMK